MDPNTALCRERRGMKMAAVNHGHEDVRAMLEVCGFNQAHVNVFIQVEGMVEPDKF